jgi:GNAT superfamily N-acetyltransferase
MDLRPISIAEARELRDAVLRPGLPTGGSIYPGDEAPDTLHAGAFMDGRLASVATVCRERMPGFTTPDTWRLRGMATLARWRGNGLGKRLAERCIAHAAEHGGALLWCSARIGTAAFYRALGFNEHGEPFRLPEYSDELYVFMQRPLP